MHWLPRKKRSGGEGGGSRGAVVGTCFTGRVAGGLRASVIYNIKPVLNWANVSSGT